MVRFSLFATTVDPILDFLQVSNILKEIESKNFSNLHEINPIPGVHSWAFGPIVLPAPAIT